MTNKIIYITSREANQIKEKAIQNENVFLVEIEGAEIKTEEEYVQAATKSFCFPSDLPSMKIGWYRDYICDLMWIEQKDIVVLIYDYDLMLADEQSTKEIIMDDFKEVILPWWEGEVVGHMVGGTPRKFMIYLVKSVSD